MPRRPRDNSPEATWERAWRRYQTGCRLSHTERLDEATTKFAEAAKLFRAAGDEGAIALCIRLMGVMYLNRHDPAQALELFREALRVAEAAGDREASPACVENIGDAYFALEDYPAAQEQLTHALVLYREFENQHGAASVLCSLGHCKLATHQVAEAMDLYGEALERFTALGDQEGMFDLSIALANGAIEAQDNPAAIGYLEQALVIGHELGGPYAAYVTDRLRELGVAPQPRPKRKQRGY